MRIEITRLILFAEKLAHKKEQSISCVLRRDYLLKLKFIAVSVLKDPPINI